MANLLVQNVDDALAQRLEERAKANGRSAEAEHRRILEEALRPGAKEAPRPPMSGRELWESLSRGGPADVDFGGGTDDTTRPAVFE